MHDGLIAVNGVVSAPADAKIPAMDRGFLVGDSIFETLVAFGKEILDGALHLERLRQSADIMRLDLPWTDAELLFEMQSLAAKVPALKKNIRFVVTRGEGFGLKIRSPSKPNRITYCFPAALEPDTTYAQGLKLKRKNQGFTERGASPKSGSMYVRAILALQQAEREGFQEILWSNADGEITESSTANIFLIGREGDLVEIATPPAQSGILLGITRKKMMDLCARAKINVTERVIFVDEIPRFDEAFLCSTVRGLVPIAAIDSHKMHSARAESVFRNLERLYLTYVETQLGYGVNWNTGEKLADNRR